MEMATVYISQQQGRCNTLDTIILYLPSIYLTKCPSDLPKTFQLPNETSPRCLIGRVETEAWGLVMRWK